MTRVRLAGGIASALACALLITSSAHAAFPGKNGKIAFRSERSVGFSVIYDLATVNSDGTGQTTLATCTGCASGAPGWSADGQKVVFEGVDPDPNSYGNGVEVVNADGSGRALVYDGSHEGYPRAGWSPDSGRVIFGWYFCPAEGDCSEYVDTVNPDGTGDVNLTGHSGLNDPAWSPNGAKIAVGATGGGIFTVNPDGSNQTRLSSGADSYPDWSPDGSRIVFTHNDISLLHGEIWVMNADGSGQTPLLADSFQNRQAVFSPDGTKIAFSSNRGGDGYHIYVMNADGTGVTRVSTAVGRAPDWQPLPINGYARPKGATPFQTYLTVAYKPCTSPNEQQGAPLAALSCSPPQQPSDYLTVGTLDSNGQKANAIGSVRYDVKPGTAVNPADDADVKMAISIKDVRMKSDLSDYAGELEVTSARRITDKLNTPAPDGTTQAATTQDTPFSLTVPCDPTTSDTTIGSLCSISTTADAVVPGQVAEGARSNWELGQVQVYDGGSDSDADTTADNTLFMDEGVFVP